MDYRNVEESSTIYFDRLLRVVRKRSSESYSNIIASNEKSRSTILLRITNDFERKNDDAEFEYGEGATAGLTFQCSVDSTIRVKARIEHNIEHVSSCGQMVIVPLRCQLKNFNLRFFTLMFFDASSALLFCNTYNRYLPRKKINAPLAFSYHDLVKRSKQVEECKARRCIKKGRKCEEEEVEEEVEEEEEEEEEEEVLSDGGAEEEQEEDNEPRRKRKRLDPQSEVDPNQQLNELFFEEQFGYSQTF